MTAIPLTARRLYSTSESGFCACWQLYEAAFPYAERRSLDCQRAAMANAAFHCLRLEQGGVFAGILFCWMSPAFIYVEHLAISPEMRGQGIGHQALELICGQGIPIILEIEPVDDAATERRWRFYRSAGFHRLPYHHLQPLYHNGDTPMVLELLSYPHAMSEDEVAACELFMRSLVSRYTEEGLIMIKP